jgi:hypothetical protein
MRNDKHGRKFNFTSEPFLAKLQEREVEGWVYMLPRTEEPEYRDKYYNPVTETAWEYRIFHDVKPDAWIKTQYDDLPPSVIVLDGEVADMHTFIQTLPDADLMEHIDTAAGTVNVRALGGYFPLEIHPYISKSE